MRNLQTSVFKGVTYRILLTLKLTMMIVTFSMSAHAGNTAPSDQGLLASLPIINGIVVTIKEDPDLACSNQDYDSQIEGLVVTIPGVQIIENIKFDLPSGASGRSTILDNKGHEWSTRANAIYKNLLAANQAQLLAAASGKEKAIVSAAKRMNNALVAHNKLLTTLRGIFDNSTLIALRCIKVESLGAPITLAADPDEAISDSVGNYNSVLDAYPLPDGAQTPVLTVIDTQLTPAMNEVYGSYGPVLEGHTAVENLPVMDATNINSPGSHGDLMSYISTRTNPEGQVYPIVVAPSSNNIPRLEPIVDAFNFAASNAKSFGSNTISYSMGSVYGNTSVIRNAIKNAYDNGISIVQAAGNEGIKKDSSVVNDPNLITVGVLGPDGKLKSNYGDFGPDLVLQPSGDFGRPAPNGQNVPMSGQDYKSSGAANIVATVIARMRILFPFLTPKQIKDILCGTADILTIGQVGDGTPNGSVKCGRLNIGNAYKYIFEKLVKPPPPPPPPPPSTWTPHWIATPWMTFWKREGSISEGWPMVAIETLKLSCVTRGGQVMPESSNPTVMDTCIGGTGGIIPIMIYHDINSPATDDRWSIFSPSGTLP